MTKREYCEHLNKLQSEAVELQTVANVEYGEFDEKLEDAICAIRAAIERLIPEEELHKSEPQRPEYDTPSFKENPEDEQIKSDKQRPQRWPEYETPSFKKKRRRFRMSYVWRNFGQRRETSCGSFGVS